LGLTVALLAALAGCPPKTEETLPAAAGKTTVKFLAMEYDTNTRPFMQVLEKGFEEANPDVDLIIEVIDWNLGKDKLSTLVSAGNAPDLANIATLWLPEYVHLGVVEPLDDYLKPEFRERFIPLTLHGAEYEGKLYGLPIAVSARALYYNQTLLDEAGAKPPTTWEELVEVARKCTHPEKGIYGFGVQGAKVETDVYWYYFLWANGGELLSEDQPAAPARKAPAPSDTPVKKALDAAAERVNRILSQEAPATGGDGRRAVPGAAAQPAAATMKAAFNDAAGVEALQFVCDLVHKEKVTEPKPTAYDRENLQEMFKAGKLAMMITGPWFWGMLEKEAPDLEYGIAPIPAHKKQVTMAVTDNLILFQSCADKDAAWKFVEYFYRTDLRQKWAQTFGMLPELKEVAESDFIRQSPQWSTFMDLLETGQFVPLHPRWNAIAVEISAGVQEALLAK
jgi:multiple sugar transport system substrate-binding protein